MDQLTAAALFSDEAVAEVTSRYPGLTRAGPRSIAGVIDVHAIYLGEEIKDTFTVKIRADNPHSTYLPALYETGKRTASIARSWKIRDLRDLHHNTDGTACVCVRQEERQHFPEGSGLLSFVEALAVPYLCGLHRFERDGRWPGGDYSHGSVGLLEYYAEPTQPLSYEEAIMVFETIRREVAWRDYYKQVRRPSPERRCLCGSGKPFNRCHPVAWQGVLNLRRELERLRLSLRDPLASAKAAL